MEESASHQKDHSPKCKEISAQNRAYKNLDCSLQKMFFRRAEKQMYQLPVDHQKALDFSMIVLTQAKASGIKSREENRLLPLASKSRLSCRERRASYHDENYRWLFVCYDIL